MAESVLDGEWQRAEECLGAATLCLDHGFYADAVSRSYYAVLHAAKAALAYVIATDAAAAEDLLPESHEGVINRFGMRLVRPGHIERMWATFLGQLSQLRFSADYDVMTIISETVSREAAGRAASFLDRMRSLLGGLTP